MIHIDHFEIGFSWCYRLWEMWVELGSLWTRNATCRVANLKSGFEYVQDEILELWIDGWVLNCNATKLSTIPTSLLIRMYTMCINFGETSYPINYKRQNLLKASITILFTIAFPTYASRIFHTYAAEVVLFFCFAKIGGMSCSWRKSTYPCLIHSLHAKITYNKFHIKNA